MGERDGGQGVREERERCIRSWGTSGLKGGKEVSAEVWKA